MFLVYYRRSLYIRIGTEYPFNIMFR